MTHAMLVISLFILVCVACALIPFQRRPIFCVLLAILGLALLEVLT